MIRKAFFTMATLLMPLLENVLISIPYARHHKPRLVYFFDPISKDHLYTVTFGLIYGLYSRAASNQERPMMARVR